MRYSLMAAAAASALLLGACGDDSSSGAGTVSNALTGQLYVDEAQKLIVMTADDIYIDQCVVKGETDFVWESVKQPNDVDSSKYDFLGDTLVLYDIDEGTVDSYGDLFVGGSAGNIYGTWDVISCGYDSRTGEKNCHEYNTYRKQSLEFSPGKVISSVEYYFDRYLADVEATGFMKSYFMREVYRVLNGGSYFDADASDIFNVYNEGDEDYDYFTRIIESNHVQIVDESKTSQTFKIGEKTYTVSVKKSDASFEFNYYAYTNEDASVDVTDGVKTCNAYTVRKIMDKNLCNAENAQFFKISHDEDDEYSYVRYYKNSNDAEFEECLKSIAVVQPENQDANPLNAMYKKSASKKSDAESRAEKRFRKWMKYIAR